MSIEVLWLWSSNLKRQSSLKIILLAVNHVQNGNPQLPKQLPDQYIQPLSIWCPSWAPEVSPTDWSPLLFGFRKPPLPEFCQLHLFVKKSIRIWPNVFITSVVSLLNISKYYIIYIISFISCTYNYWKKNIVVLIDQSRIHQTSELDRSSLTVSLRAGPTKSSNSCSVHSGASLGKVNVPEAVKL